MNLFRLDGKVALVTGASRGIGQAMAIALAQAGADVAGAAQGDQAGTQAAVEACGRHLRAALFLAQAAARRFVQRGRGGKVINVASMLSLQGGVRVASYTAAKSGLMGITRLLANEWAPLGINVNATAPGYIATDNTLVLRQDEKRNGEILARIPAGRWGRPDDLAGATVFLAAAASDYMHGHTLAVDGGWLAR